MCQLSLQGMDDFPGTEWAALLLPFLMCCAFFFAKPPFLDVLNILLF